MNLDAYLKALEECPDEYVEIDSTNGTDTPTKRSIHKLTAEFGVYDNWPIFLNADFKNAVDHLTNSDYTMIDTFGEGEIIKHIMHYIPGTVELRIMNFFPSGLATGYISEEGKEHFQRQEANFTMGLILHPYQKKKIKDISETKAMTLVIKDISAYAKKEGTALCFPNSIGWNHSRDYSRIVYYP